MKKTLIFIILLLVMPLVISADHSTEEHTEIVDIVVFYGEGCPHCAKLEEFLYTIEGEYNLDIKTFEVYHNETNRELAITMAKKYKETFKSVPMTFIGDEIYLGYSESMNEELIRKIKSCQTECCNSPLDQIDICQPGEEKKEKLTMASVVALAIADSINPCALAVLAMVLVALLIKDPTKKKNVLLGGLSFTAAVFVTYMIYGAIIIQFFKFLDIFFVAASKYARIIFAIFAIILGILNFKDYLRYKPGGFATEMPMFLRPSAKRMIKNITKPRGAFIIGIFVTLFLLPCTIGPYLVVGNLLSAFDLIKVVPWLLLYNIIFVLPMIIVTLGLYFGYTSINKVTGWKEEHVKYLHLTAGIVLTILGILMLLGII